MGVHHRTGALLRNHGATTYGYTLDKAYTRSIYLEWVCRLYHQASQIGEPRLLTAEQLDEVAQALGTYGQSVKREGGAQLFTAATGDVRYDFGCARKRSTTMQLCSGE